jgi:hypothetical protein
MAQNMDVNRGKIGHSGDWNWLYMVTNMRGQQQMDGGVDNAEFDVVVDPAMEEDKEVVLKVAAEKSIVAVEQVVEVVDSEAAEGFGVVADLDTGEIELEESE